MTPLLSAVAAERPSRTLRRRRHARV